MRYLAIWSFFILFVNCSNRADDQNRINGVNELYSLNFDDLVKDSCLLFSTFDEPCSIGQKGEILRLRIWQQNSGTSFVTIIDEAPNLVCVSKYIKAGYDNPHTIIYENLDIIFSVRKQLLSQKESAKLMESINMLIDGRLNVATEGIPMDDIRIEVFENDKSRIHDFEGQLPQDLIENLNRVAKAKLELY